MQAYELKAILIMTWIICCITCLVQITHIEADKLFILPVNKAGHPSQSNIVTYDLNHDISTNPWSHTQSLLALLLNVRDKILFLLVGKQLTVERCSFGVGDSFSCKSPAKRSFNNLKFFNCSREIWLAQQFHISNRLLNNPNFDHYVGK